MCRRDEADIVTAALLQFEHHFGKTFVRYLVLFLFFPGLRDLIILAIDAAEIAVAEEDVACAVRAAQTRLFAKMSGVARHNRQPPRVTRGDLVIEPVVAAIFRADGA